MAARLPASVHGTEPGGTRQHQSAPREGVEVARTSLPWTTQFRIGPSGALADNHDGGTSSCFATSLPSVF